MKISVPNTRGGVRCHSAGFSIMELMLGIGVLSAIMVMYLSFQMRQQDTQTGVTLGEELASAQALLQQYFLTNRQEIMAAIQATNASDPNVQKHCIVRVANTSAPVNATAGNGVVAWSGGATINDGKKTCAFDLSLLQAYGLWPRSLTVTRNNPETGGLGRWTAIVRGVRKPGPDNILGNADDVLGEDAEMLVVFADDNGNLGTIVADAWRRNEQLQTRVFAQRDALGQAGGMIPVGAIGVCNATQSSVQACGSGWRVDLSQWLDTTQYNALRTKLPTN